MLVSKKMRPPERSEAAMDRLALANDTPDGEVYLSSYEGSKRDLMALDQKESVLDRIRRRAQDTRANTAELLAA